ncbi:MAG: FAD-dependent oxidoreductase [Thermoanaerobaculales bacterium]|nr:FAD-dependent oxidoreductase [Thermoanaerobaculales bacterium]
MKKILIIGGGLAGLVVAERLGNAGLVVTVLEREAEAGGVCRSLQQGKYTFDYTGHLLHVACDETKEYLKDLGIWSRLDVHTRNAGIHLGGEITPYPIQIHTWGLPPRIRRDCLLGFVRAWADRGGEEPTSFREWVLERFGEGLAEHFFFPYNEKLYRTKAEELCLDWVGRYVPKPDLEEVVDGALGLHDEAVGYNAVFRYPTEGGIRLLPDSVAGRIAGLHLGAEVVKVNLGEKWVETADGSRLSWDHLVATLSLPLLVDRTADDLPQEVVDARRALRWVRVVNLALGVRGAAPVDHHWLYFPEIQFPFYRVGFPSNHGGVAPEGCHTVSVEISLDPDGGVPGDLMATAERALVDIGLLDQENIEERVLTMLDPAYVVFDHHRREAVATLRQFYADHGVQLTGRWAEWKYSAMEDAILDGMNSARRFIRSFGD